MHMADALLSPAVGAAMCAVSAGAIAYSSVRIKKEELGEKKIPVMAVSGAFIFAAQMINFTIPVTGSSGHIGGGMLLAAMLGGSPALLTMAAVLIIQCLFFADGGLLALGCNIFNMGVIPCLIMYPLVFKPMLRRGISYGRITAASIISVVVGLQLGAFCVVLETLASGITELPFGTFVALMLPIHLAIGAVEGVVTAAVLCFVYRARPELIESAISGGSVGKGVSMKKLVIAVACAAILVGGGLAIFASPNPDGLEWSIQGVTGSTEVESKYDYSGVQGVQDKTAVMPDYTVGSSEGAASTSAAGIIGVVMTFVFAGLVGLVITLVKKKNHHNHPQNPST